MALGGLLEFFRGNAAKDRPPMVLDVTSSGETFEERKKREELAQAIRRTQALQQGRQDSIPPALRLSPEEKALTQTDIANQLNEQAAREEIARDNALIDAGLPPFAVRPGFNLNDPEGNFDRVTDYESVMPPPAPAAKPAPSKSDLKEITVPKRERKMDDPLMKNIANMLNPPEIKSVSGGPTSGRGAVQDPGFLSRAGRGILDYLSDPVNRKSLAIGFNAMTLNPDRGFQAAMQSQIENIQEQRLAAKAGNQTADYLERQGLFAEAELIRANPELASDILASTSLGGESAYQKELEKIIAQDDRDLVNQAFDARENYNRTKDTLALLDEPMFLGRFSEAKTELAKVLQGLGVDSSDQNAFGEWLQTGDNTLRMRALLGQQVFQAIGELGIGARGLDTPAERQFLIEVMAGSPGQTKGFLQSLLTDRMRKQESIIRRYNNALGEGRLDRFSRLARRPLSPIDISIFEDAGQPTIQGVSDEEVAAAIQRNLGGA